ncbi:MAG TPA: transglutaminase-like domain-containing protein [Stellaceae bacterium]|nr:transglutaminase-like domain-containing protein [Stellaceae bacterium]
MTGAGMENAGDGIPFRDRDGALAYLKALASLDDEALPIGTAALALASLDRPRVDLERYHRHLWVLARDLGEAAAGISSMRERAAALASVILEAHRYTGDSLTYDDLQNANLMRVIDRRKGLPVALGILYLHAGRAQGWRMAGLAFPGHFLVSLDAPDGHAILDPFNGGSTQSAATLRELLKRVGGAERELAPTDYRPVSDREVLLRLQNNLKRRLLENRQAEAALVVIDTMLLFAPDRAELLREHGMVNAALGNLGAARDSLERSIERERDSRLRFATAALLRDLKTRLQ